MTEYTQVVTAALGLLVVFLLAARLFRPVHRFARWAIGPVKPKRESWRSRVREPGGQATAPTAPVPRNQDDAVATRRGPAGLALGRNDPPFQSAGIDTPHQSPRGQIGPPSVRITEPTPGWWAERRTVVLGSPHTPTDPHESELPRGASSGNEPRDLTVDMGDPGRAKSDQPLTRPILRASNGVTSHAYQVEEGVLFDPEHFPGLTTALHVKNRAGVLFVSVQPGSAAITMGGVRLGAVPLPLRRSDIVTNGSWAFSIDEAPGLMLALDSQRPSDPLIALEVSGRGDCVALTSAMAAPSVRQLGSVCFAPIGPRPADDALQLARSAAIKTGLASEDWDLSIVGVDQAGVLHYAGPLIDEARTLTGSSRVRRGDLITVSTRGSGEVTLRVL